MEHPLFWPVTLDADPTAATAANVSDEMSFTEVLWRTVRPPQTINIHLLSFTAP